MHVCFNIEQMICLLVFLEAPWVPGASVNQWLRLATLAVVDYQAGTCRSQTLVAYDLESCQQL